MISGAWVEKSVPTTSTLGQVTTRKARSGHRQPPVREFAPVLQPLRLAHHSLVRECQRFGIRRVAHWDTGTVHLDGFHTCLSNSVVKIPNPSSTSSIPLHPNRGNRITVGLLEVNGFWFFCDRRLRFLQNCRFCFQRVVRVEAAGSKVSAGVVRRRWQQYHRPREPSWFFLFLFLFLFLCQDGRLDSWGDASIAAISSIEGPGLALLRPLHRRMLEVPYS